MADVPALLGQGNSEVASSSLPLTGYGDEASRQRAREARFDAHLTKPPDFDLLRQVLERG